MIAAVVNGFSHFQAGACTVALGIIAAAELYRCLPGRSK